MNQPNEMTHEDRVINDFIQVIQDHKLSIVTFLKTSIQIARDLIIFNLYKDMEEKDKILVANRLRDSYQKMIPTLNELSTETNNEDVLLFLDIMEFAIIKNIEDITEEGEDL